MFCNLVLKKNKRCNLHLLKMHVSCAAGDYHNITLSNDGVVHSFGSNKYGELGLGHNNNVSLPTPIPNLPKIMEISCGSYFTVCIDNEGGLWSFGYNNYGQLGTGNTTNYNIPQKIKHIPPVRSVSCGCYHALIITNDSNLWSCGYNDHGELCLGNKAGNQSKYQQTSFQQISKISAGGYHSFFQNNKGEIFGCGHNQQGEVGLGHFNHPQINVTLIPNLPLNIVQFCSGYYHSLFMDSDGNAFSVGHNEYGQLGLGHNNNQNVLNQIPNIPPTRSISCVGYSSYLVDIDGNLWSFGFNGYGQLGHGDKANIPTKIECLKNITQTAQGSCGYHFLAKDSQNKIFVMGRNYERQLGTGDNQSLSSPQEIDFQYFSIWGNSQTWGNHQKTTNGWKHMCSEETMNWNEKEMKKLEILQPKINQVKFDLQSNNNNKIKQEFPPNSFESWNDAQTFLNEKYQQINEKLNKKQEIENQITEDVNQIENELKDIDHQIQQLQNRKKELEENHLPNVKKMQSGLVEIFTKIEETKNVLEEMCSDVSKFCENENEMNEELSELFKQKKFEEFNYSDVSKLLWKMDMVRYQSLFELNQINGLAISLLSDDKAWAQLGVEQRDSYYISFYFKMMKSSGYYKTFSDDYDFDCCVCSHNTPEKTIHLLKEYEIPIEDNFILENNYCSPLLISKLFIKDMLGKDYFSQKGIQIMRKLKEWRKIHKRHLNQLKTK